MSTSIIDKENASELQFHPTGRKFGDSLGGANFTKSQLSTPQHKLKSNIFDHKSKTIHKLKDPATNEKQRRVLGDLLNSTNNKPVHRQSLVFNCATPKSNLSSKFGTPISKCMKQLTNDFARQSLSNVKSDQTEQQENYPPVEKCIQQVDTFSDLFEDGKISDIFLGKNVTYVPRLPSGKVDCSDEFHGFEIYSDKKWDKELKEMNKSMKNQTKKENKDFLEIYQEVPELAELPPILEDFDLSLELSLSDDI